MVRSVREGREPSDNENHLRYTPNNSLHTYSKGATAGSQGFSEKIFGGLYTQKLLK